MKLVTIQPFFNRALNPETTPLDANGLPLTNYLHDPLAKLSHTLPAIYDGENAYYPITNLGYNEKSWNEWILHYGYDPQATATLRERFEAYRRNHPYTNLMGENATMDNTKPNEGNSNDGSSNETTANEATSGENEQTPPNSPYFSKFHARLFAPIPQPLQDILCIGMNYCASEAERQKLPPPENMMYFGKRSYRLAGHGEILPNLANTTDFYLFEAELAVILGKPLYRAQSQAEVREAIFAYSMFNDFTAPKICANYQQIYVGKSLPGFSVLGPWLIPASEIDTQGRQVGENSCLKLKLQGFKNGCLVQEGLTTQMIRSVEEMLLELSQNIILAPGTIIATGTPPDVPETEDSNLVAPYKKIRPDDKIDCYCPAIGHLQNQIDT